MKKNYFLILFCSIFFFFSCGCTNQFEVHPSSLFDENKIKAYLVTYQSFLSDVFPNYDKNSTGHLRTEYYNLTERVDLVLSYFRTSFFQDSEKEEEFIEFSEFLRFYEFFWQEPILLEQLSSSDVFDGKIRISFTKTSRNYKPIFWKIEELEEGNYQLYLVNLAGILDQANTLEEQNYILDIFQSGNMTIEEMKHYKPEVLVIKFRMRNNQYLLLTSDFYENYLF